MQKIIDTLKRALHTKENFQASLEEDVTYTYHATYPVAVVHHKKRIKEENTIDRLEAEGFLDADGYTPKEYTQEQIDRFVSVASAYVKYVSFLCTDNTTDKRYKFQEKRSGDYWKKIVNPETFKAVIEYSAYIHNEDICKIEFDLREVMRSSKEVPSLKVLPFITVIRASADVDLETLMLHYFNDDYFCMTQENETIAIGWSATLQEVNMRYFVCNPK